MERAQKYRQEKLTRHLTKGQETIQEEAHGPGKVLEAMAEKVNLQEAISSRQTIEFLSSSKSACVADNQLQIPVSTIWWLVSRAGCSSSPSANWLVICAQFGGKSVVKCPGAWPGALVRQETQVGGLQEGIERNDQDQEPKNKSGCAALRSPLHALVV